MREGAVLRHFTALWCGATVQHGRSAIADVPRRPRPSSLV